MENKKELTPEQKNELNVLIRIVNEKKIKFSELQLHLEAISAQLNTEAQKKKTAIDEIMNAKSMFDSRLVDLAKAHGINHEEIVKGLWTFDTSTMTFSLKAEQLV